MPRNICIFIDGTNMFSGGLDQPLSNIYKLSCMAHDFSKSMRDQLVFYIPGIGSENKKNLKSSTLFAKDIEYQIKQIYLILVTNYRQDDSIFLFGYSRGAASARAIAYIIEHYGLLKANQVERLPGIWADLKSFRTHSAPKNDKNYHYPKVELLACLDTVIFPTDNRFIRRILGMSSRTLSHENLNISENVKNAIHLISIDANERYFPSIPFFGAVSTTTNFMQLLVPGGHGDVGGTKPTVAAYLSLMTIKAYAARRTDLKFFNRVHADLPVHPLLDFSNIRTNRISRYRWQHKRRRLLVGNLVAALSHCKPHPIFRKINNKIIRNAGKDIKYSVELPKFGQRIAEQL